MTGDIIPGRERFFSAPCWCLPYETPPINIVNGRGASSPRPLTLIELLSTVNCARMNPTVWVRIDEVSIIIGISVWTPARIGVCG